MDPAVRRLAPTCLALALALSACAGPTQLARQSGEALARGDVRGAYDRALRAVDQDPHDPGARAAYLAAAEGVAADYRARVRTYADSDTTVAAEIVLELRQFRLDAARNGAALAPAPGFDATEAAVLGGAARAHYARGRAALAADRPRAAVGEFALCRRYDPGYADAGARLAAALAAATTRVAVLPFADGTGVPGLAREIAARMQAALAQRADSEFQFTRLVAADTLARALAASPPHDLGRDEALALGRSVGADRVVIGSLRDLRSNTGERDVTLPLYRRSESQDLVGNLVERWAASTLPIETRACAASVRVTFEVVDVASGATLVRRDLVARTLVRTVWTEYTPDPADDCGRYALLPPDVRRADPARAGTVDAQWRDLMGTWDLKAFLLEARDHRERANYSPGDRAEFLGDTRQHPVWMGQLPDENEMAFIVLEGAWRPVRDALGALDATE